MCLCERNALCVTLCYRSLARERERTAACWMCADCVCCVYTLLFLWVQFGLYDGSTESLSEPVLLKTCGKADVAEFPQQPYTKSHFDKQSVNSNQPIVRNLNWMWVNLRIAATATTTLKLSAVLLLENFRFYYHHCATKEEYTHDGLQMCCNNQIYKVL